MKGIFVSKNHKCNFYHAEDIGKDAYEEHIVQMKNQCSLNVRPRPNVKNKNASNIAWGIVPIAVA